MTFFEPHLEVLPHNQRRLWPDLRAVPPNFVLYGGTALALRLAHRQSVDFDFFSADTFNPEELQRALPFAAGAEVLQKQANTLTIRTIAPENVRLSFFGGLTLAQIEPPGRCRDNQVNVAGLKDLLAAKLNAVYQRAEAKDYLDIDAILQTGITFEQGLGYAQAVYGSGFNPMLPMKALTYFDDGDLPGLPPALKQRLMQAVETVREIPPSTSCSGRIKGGADSC